MPVINHIHSATIVVRDQDRAVDFYVNTLGFEKRRDDSFMSESRWIEVVPPNTSTALALVTPAAMSGHWPEETGDHTDVSLVTHDIGATYEELIGRGVEFTGPPEQMPWGAKATWFNDPDGNRFFLAEE